MHTLCQSVKLFMLHQRTVRYYYLVIDTHFLFHVCVFCRNGTDCMIENTLKMTVARWNRLIYTLYVWAINVWSTEKWCTQSNCIVWPKRNALNARHYSIPLHLFNMNANWYLSMKFFLLPFRYEMFYAILMRNNVKVICRRSLIYFDIYYFLW